MPTRAVRRVYSELLQQVRAEHLRPGAGRYGGNIEIARIERGHRVFTETVVGYDRLRPHGPRELDQRRSVHHDEQPESGGRRFEEGLCENRLGRLGQDREPEPEPHAKVDVHRRDVRAHNAAGFEPKRLRKGLHCNAKA